MNFLAIAVLLGLTNADGLGFIELQKESDVIRVEEGSEISTAFTVVLTEEGKQAEDDGKINLERVEFVISFEEQDERETVLRQVTGQDAVIMRPFREEKTDLRFNSSLSESGDGDAWVFNLLISNVTVDNIDQFSISVEFTSDGLTLIDKSAVHVWRAPSEITIETDDLVGDSMDTNITDIASCAVIGAHPEPTSVTMFIGDVPFSGLEIINGSAVLSKSPSEFTPGDQFDQKEIRCQVEVVVEGETVAIKTQPAGANSTYTLTYPTSHVDIQVSQSGKPLEQYNAESWVEKGEKVQIDCSANGNPSPEIVLSQDGVDVLFTGGDALGTTTSGQALSDTISRDRTTLSCSAGGIEDVVEIRTHYMKGSPTFSNDSETHIFVEGEPIDITCIPPNANPRANTQLKKDGDEIDNYHLQGVADISMSGNYTCTATNHFHSAESELTLQVKIEPAPEPSSSNVLVIVIIIVVVAILIIGAVLFFIKKKNDEKGDDGTDPDVESPAEMEPMNPEEPPATSTIPRSDDSSGDEN